MCEASESQPQERKDRDLSTWYKSDWLSSNLRTIISEIEVEPEPVVVFESSDSKWKYGLPNRNLCLHLQICSRVYEGVSLTFVRKVVCSSDHVTWQLLGTGV